MLTLAKRGKWAVTNSVVSLFSGSGTRMAAQLTYYLLVSMPALLLIVVWVFSAVFDRPDVRTDIVESLVQALPLDSVAGADEVEKLLDSVAEGAGALGIFAVIGAFYGVSGLTAAVRFAIESAAVERFGITRQQVGHGFVSSKLTDFGTTLVAIVLLLVLAGLAVTNPLLSIIEKEFPIVGEASIYVVPVAILLVLATMFTIFNRALSPPNLRMGFAGAVSGALVTTVAIAILAVALRVYFAVFTGSSAIYGALAGFLAVAFTLNLVSLMIVYGAHFGYAIQMLRRQREEDGEAGQVSAADDRTEGEGEPSGGDGEDTAARESV